MIGAGRRTAPSARGHALAVLRVRSTALGLALLPAAAAVILWTGRATGHLPASGGWDTARWVVTGLAVLALAYAGLVATVVVRARPAVSPTVPLDESAAPDLYGLVRDLAERLDVPAPSALALTPDCDSWLEDRTHPAQARGAQGPAGGRARLRRGARSQAPVLVIGSPFLWWMRVAELRALLAPVVAGTGPSAHPDIAAARRWVRGLDAACAVAERAAARRRTPRADGRGPLRPGCARLVGPCVRLMLRAVGPHATEMERGVAAAAAERAQNVDYGLRVVAQEQVGLAYAGWDRLLTRVALPAWRLGLWPTRLDAGVVSALTELSRRDRLAEGFTSRLGERPACDLLEEPGAVDAEVSLLAARLFLGSRPPPLPGARAGDPAPDWAPVEWPAYPEEVVDRIWRTEAARLFEALDSTADPASGEEPARAPEPGSAPDGPELYRPTLARVLGRFAAPGGSELLAAHITAQVARAEAAGAGGMPGAPPPHPGHPGTVPAAGSGDALPAPSPMGLPLRPPRGGTELLVEHVVATVCCAAVDTAGAVPGLDWLDGPTLQVGGERCGELSRLVRALVEEGDGRGLEEWLGSVGVRADKPVRLV